MESLRDCKLAIRACILHYAANSSDIEALAAAVRRAAGPINRVS